jgi:hypothetical protein
MITEVATPNSPWELRAEVDMEPATSGPVTKKEVQHARVKFSSSAIATKITKMA